MNRAERGKAVRSKAGAMVIRKDQTVRSRVGIIGYGALGREMVRTFVRLGEIDTVAAVLVRPGAIDLEMTGIWWVTDGAGMIAAGPTIVAECAGHGGKNQKKKYRIEEMQD